MVEPSPEQYVGAHPESDWSCASFADSRTLQQWLNKPDGKRGWASYFLDLGYEVLIVDITATGRSSSRELPPIVAGPTTENAQRGFTAPELSRDYYQARFHTQWPGVSIIPDRKHDGDGSLICDFPDRPG